MNERESARRRAILVLLPLVALAGFIGPRWWRGEREWRAAVARTTAADARYRLAPPLGLREFSADEAHRRRMNLETLRFTFRASLQEEVEASLRQAIENGTFAPSVSGGAASKSTPDSVPDSGGPK